MHTAGHMQEESYMKHLSKLGPGIKFFYEKERSRALIWNSIISLSIYFKFIIVYSIKVNSLFNLF